MKVLFTSPVLRHPPNGGPTLRIQNSIKALHRVCDLMVYHWGTQGEIGGGVAERFLSETSAAHVIENPGGVGLGRIVTALGRRAVGRTAAWRRYGERVRSRGVARAAGRWRADVVWLGFGNISYSLLRDLKNLIDTPVVVDTDSVWSRFVLRELDFESDPVRRKRVGEEGAAKAHEEAWGTVLADATLAVSEVDAAYYRGLADKPGKVHVFSNVIDVPAYALPSLPPHDFKGPSVLLAGSFWKRSPMEDAARWLVSEVMPRVRERTPELQLYVVGRGSRETVGDLAGDGIAVVGEVASVLPYLHNVDVVVVPLRFESGTRFKILEAGACGRPVVSTTLGAEGLPFVARRHGLIADTPSEFAAALCEVIANREEACRMGAELRSLVEAHFGVDSAATQARGILDYLAR